MTKSWVSFLLVVLVASTARAQPKQDADAAFTAGTEAFNRQDYAACVDHFRRAYAIRQHDAVRFNIAVCLERRQRYREAIEEYERAAASQQLDEEARGRATASANALRERLARIAIAGPPSGSAVPIDGAEACRAPCTAVVDPGRHEVVVHVGKRRERRVVDVESGATARVVLRAPARRKRPAVEDEPSVSPGPLTWIGTGLAAVGIAGIVGFGVRATSLSEDFDAAPSEELADEGELMKNLANASIGVAALGAVLIAIDLIWVGRRQTDSASLGSWRF